VTDINSFDRDDELDIGESYSAVELEDVGYEENIIEPFDPTKIRVETRPLTIDLLIARIEEHEINLTPDFQRKFIWPEYTQSRLIESLLIRIPLPAFYMDATDDDKWVVIDGLQRLNTLRRFVITKQLRLTGLEFLSQFNGKTYDDLPRNFQRRIREAQVTAFLITRGTPDEVKFTIFRRINTGGVPLSPQEIRHATNLGPITIKLAELADSDEFRQVIAKGVPDERMEDRELVLRFMAFVLTPATEYTRQDFDIFLNKAMKKLNNLPSEQLEQLGESFKRAMSWAYKIFDKEAFRKRYKPKDRRRQINKPLFESWSVNLHKLDDDQLCRLCERKDILYQTFIKLLNEDRVFDNAVSQGTGDVNKIKYRFNRIEQLITEVLA
jgi:hypothetical protein